MAKTILIVDDEAGHLLMLDAFLKERGYKVIVANDGEEALKKASLSTPDLVLLDIMMPKMDGTEVALALKENPATKHVPIFFLTAVITAEDRVESLGGSNVIFPKPVNFRLLLEKIKEITGD